ncbi:MAG: DUF3109 family protein [Anaerolineales bacterium]|nr:DUF3109 family protein [Anaerolineales bacterium]
MNKELIINSLRVDADLLQRREVRRCNLAECQSSCCSGGVYITVREAEDVLAHAEIIQPFLPEARRDPALWFDDSREPDDDHPVGEMCTGTSVINDPSHPAGTTCIFLRPDRLCALQKASIETGEHPWRYKPYYCALHPLVWDEKVLVLAEGSEVYLEGGSCNRPAPGAPIQLVELFDDELTLALGADGYSELRTVAQQHNGGG